MRAEVMEFYGLTRSPRAVGYFETTHHRQLLQDIKQAVYDGDLVALCGVPALLNSMGWMLEGAGVSASGWVGRARVKLLLGIYLSLLRVWAKAAGYCEGIAYVFESAPKPIACDLFNAFKRGWNHARGSAAGLS